jgi:hypothetical protein
LAETVKVLCGSDGGTMADGSNNSGELPCTLHVTLDGKTLLRISARADLRQPSKSVSHCKAM